MRKSLRNQKENKFLIIYDFTVYHNFVLCDSQVFRVLICLKTWELSLLPSEILHKYLKDFAISLNSCLTHQTKIRHNWIFLYWHLQRDSLRIWIHWKTSLEGPEWHCILFGLLSHRLRLKSLQFYAVFFFG